MDTIRRKDSTIITEEDMKNILKEIESVGKQMGEFLPISELRDGIVLTTSIGLAQIVNVVINKEEVIFDIQYNSYEVANKIVYPICKELDKKTKLFFPRFTALVEWELLKNIDNIAKNIG